MAAVAGLGHTRALPNYQNELYNATPNTARFLSILGGISGANTSDRATDATWQTTDNNTPAQAGGIEGAAPTYEERDRAAANNVYQQFKYGIDLSWEKQTATAQLAAPGTASDLLVANGAAGIASELAFQTDMKLKRMARDLNYSLINGVYQRPTDNATERKMRGIDAVTVLAGSTDTNQAAVTLTAAHVDAHVLAMWTAGAEFEQPLILCNGFNKQVLTGLYGGDAPRSRTVGGVALEMITMDLAGDVMIAVDRDCPADTILFVDTEHCQVGLLPIVNRGTVSVTPMPADGDSDKFMLFASATLRYGLPQYHGSIYGTPTA